MSASRSYGERRVISSCVSCIAPVYPRRGTTEGALGAVGTPTVETVLSNLAAGRSQGVNVANSIDELNELFSRLSIGGKPVGQLSVYERHRNRADRQLILSCQMELCGRCMLNNETTGLYR
jgi:hypothetical protein